MKMSLSNPSELVFGTRKGLLFGTIESNYDVTLKESYFTEKEIMSFVEFEPSKFIMTSTQEQAYIWYFERGS